MHFFAFVLVSCLAVSPILCTPLPEPKSIVNSDENIITTTSASVPLEANSENVSTPFTSFHDWTIDRQNAVLQYGNSLSLNLTNTLVRPFLLFNNGVSAAVSALPGIFAANGAILGTMVATPIQLGALAMNSLASGLTGAAVSVPITAISGSTAHLVGLAESGKQFFQQHLTQPNSEVATTETPKIVETQTSAPNNNLQMVLQPLAVFAGSNSILAGMGLNALSQGVKHVGQGVEQLGVSLTSAGVNAKHLGAVLVGWVNGRPVYASPVSPGSFAATFSDVPVQQPLEQVTTPMPLQMFVLDQLPEVASVSQSNPGESIQVANLEQAPIVPDSSLHSDQNPLVL